MDLYNFLLFLGIAGLGTMAIRGFGHGLGHRTGQGSGATGDGEGLGHGHAGHAASHGHSHTGAHASSHASHGVGSTLLQFTSPRVLFSVALGAGAFGPLLRPLM